MYNKLAPLLFFNASKKTLVLFTRVHRPIFSNRIHKFTHPYDIRPMPFYALHHSTFHHFLLLLLLMCYSVCYPPIRFIYNTLVYHIFSICIIIFLREKREKKINIKEKIFKCAILCDMIALLSGGSELGPTLNKKKEEIVHKQRV